MLAKSYLLFIPSHINLRAVTLLSPFMTNPFAEDSANLPNSACLARKCHVLKYYFNLFGIPWKHTTFIAWRHLRVSVNLIRILEFCVFYPERALSSLMTQLLVRAVAILILCGSLFCFLQLPTTMVLARNFAKNVRVKSLLSRIITNSSWMRLKINWISWNCFGNWK